MGWFCVQWSGKIRFKIILVLYNNITSNILIQLVQIFVRILFQMSFIEKKLKNNEFFFLNVTLGVKKNSGSKNHSCVISFLINNISMCIGVRVLCNTSSESPQLGDLTQKISQCLFLFNWNKLLIKFL